MIIFVPIMSEELNLVRDLAVILIAAGLFTIISKALKQPLVLGYILAGFLVGPHINFFPGISSQEAVSEWSEIGVIFLMFTLGLEFSFKKLLKVGSSALITAGGKFIGVFVIGFLAGKGLGWTSMESIFLAGLLSMSSTAVVLKAYDDLGLKTKPYAPLVFGTLVMEDLIAILMMVLLPAMAVSQQFAGSEMLFNLAKLGFFLVLWFLVGIFVIPSVLKKAHRYLNDEILLLVSIGLCFGMVSLATAAGLSSALGAFVMGSILAETVESERITSLVGGIKNLFSAIFFVSVGMMLDPSVIGQYWATILLLVAIVILTHILFAAIGGIIAGNDLDNSLHTGFSLAQLGEFGFIIAGVGCSLGVMRDFIYPVIIAVSVITTFTTPFIIKGSDGAAAFIAGKLPRAWKEWIDEGRGAMVSKSASEQSDWKLYLKSWFLRVGLYGVMLVAVLIGSRLYLDPLLGKMLPGMGSTGRNWISVAVTLAVMAPLLYGISVAKGNPEAARRLIAAKSSNKIPLLTLVLLKIFVSISFILVTLASKFNLAGWTILLIAAAVFVFILFARSTLSRNSPLENRFLSNLNAKEEKERRMAPVATSFRDQFEGYDIKAESIQVPANSVYAGMRLKDVPLRLESGANIVKISRQGRSVTIPSGDEIIFPSDVLIAAGTSTQLEAARALISGSAVPGEEADEDFCILPTVLSEDSFLTGKVLSQAGLRSRKVTVVSILRDGVFLTNPKPDTVFHEGDTVWLAGERSSCEWIKG